MAALDRIVARSALGTGHVAPRSGDVAVATAGLARMRRLVAALGEPQLAYRTVHVAGSKGKGSTAAYAAAIMTSAGRRTGRYTSPHLVDWRERIAVDGRPIDPAAFDAVVERVDQAMRHLEAGRPGEAPHNAFELLTASAFLHFRETGCDDAVVEVGIGGRFDSTNVVEGDVAIVTTIEAEHLDILGPTLADVAWNKAGILRPGRPCVAVDQGPVVRDRLRAEAEAVGAPLLEQGRDWRYAGSAASFSVAMPGMSYAELTFANPMAPQLQNAAAAVVAAVTLGPPPAADEVRTGLATGALPGRFEVLDRGAPIVLDVAHTASSISALGEAVRAHFPGRPITVLLGILDDKDVAAIAVSVVRWADSVVATTAPSPRALPAHDIATALAGFPVRVIVNPSPDDAFTVARRQAGHDGIVVVTGSFSLVALIRSILPESF